MARYIDADELIDELARLKCKIAYAAQNKDDFPVTYGKYLGLDAAMGAVQTLPDADCDVASRAEVERLEQEIETLKDNNEHLAVMLEEAKSEVASEIFAEIDNALHDMATEYANAGHPEYFAVCEMVHHKVMRPIENKYTEETSDGKRTDR